jgi:hypothetical protein
MNKKQATVASAALASFAGAQSGVIDAETGNIILAVLNILSALLPALLKGKRDA